MTAGPEVRCPRCKCSGGSLADGYHIVCLTLNELDRERAATAELLATLEAILRAFTDAEADRLGIEREDAWQARAGIPPWLDRIASPAVAKAKGGAP